MRLDSGAFTVDMEVKKASSSYDNRKYICLAVDIAGDKMLTKSFYIEFQSSRVYYRKFGPLEAKSFIELLLLSHVMAIREG